MSLKSFCVKVPDRADDTLSYPPPYPVGKYILRYVRYLDGNWLAIIPAGQTVTVKIRNEEREKGIRGTALR